MAERLSLNMIEKEYTGKKLKKEVEFVFPEIPYRVVAVTPDYFSTLEEENKTKNDLKMVIGEDTRVIVNNPYRISYAQCGGRIVAIFNQENGEKYVKRATAFAFAKNWIMTTATNIYDSPNGMFPDRIYYYPALSGDMNNPPYQPVSITSAYIHATMDKPSADETEIYNICFLKLDEEAEKPDGYFGFRYQYTSYNTEGTMLLGYPNDLPEDADETHKGTFMYRAAGKVYYSDYSSIKHTVDASAGQEGGPLYVNWDSNGWVAIGINAYEDTNYNVGVRINRLIYGAMKMIRDGGIAEVHYIQPAKPDNSMLSNISSLFPDLKVLGEMYTKYYFQRFEVAPAFRVTIIGLCNYLRRIQYGGLLWAGALLDSVDEQFVKYVEDNNLELHDKLVAYIQYGEIPLRDSGIGYIDLAHLAATVEGYIGLTPSPDFWTGWGADLATGMANTSTVIDKMKPEDISNYFITKTAYETIGNVEKDCNYSDFCEDFDAIKIAELVSEKEDDQTFTKIPGHEFANILELYYTDFYTQRFQYIFKDLNCPIDADFDVIYNAVYTKMTGVDERAVLLPKHGENPSEEVITECCRALVKYIICEV